MESSDRASRVILSHPADLSAWGRRQLRTPWFRAYLGKTLGRVAEGQVTEEFLDVGCCGDTLDVPLTVDSVEGGSVVGEETTVEYTVGAACGLAGGWLVQSRAGP